MNVLLVCYHLEPMKTSAAVQMKDLAMAFKLAGHNVYFLAPSEKIHQSIDEEDKDGIKLIRIRANRNEDGGNVIRALHEFKMALLLPLKFNRTSLADKDIDLVAWYSPSIFFGIFIWFLRVSRKPKCFLILRDIFPDWMLGLGVIKKGPAYRLLKFMAHLQYLAADVIGVQAPSDMKLMERYRSAGRRSLVVLNNWQYPSNIRVKSPFRAAESPLEGRKIIAHLGNLGVAQGFDFIIDVADLLQSHDDIGFLLMGRGSEKSRLENLVADRGLKNVMFHDEVEPADVASVLEECSIGLVSLHRDHIGQNIPGKFLTYLLAGKPVVARVGEKSDLGDIIAARGVGFSYGGQRADEMASMVVNLFLEDDRLAQMSRECKALARDLFSPDAACRTILSNLVSHERDQ